MRVAELWRYPVKSMAGERLDEALVSEGGIAGDRVVHVSGRGSRIITSRTHPRLLGLHASLGADGEPLVAGLPWSAPGSAAAVRTAAGPEARLGRYEGPGRFDVLPLPAGPDGAFHQLGVAPPPTRPHRAAGGGDG